LSGEAVSDLAELARLADSFERAHPGAAAALQCQAAPASAAA